MKFESLVFLWECLQLSIIFGRLLNIIVIAITGLFFNDKINIVELRVSLCFFSHTEISWLFGYLWMGNKEKALYKKGLRDGLELLYILNWSGQQDLNL